MSSMQDNAQIMLFGNCTAAMLMAVASLTVNLSVAPAAEGFVIAQAGSTGGSIGKQGKSASGSDDAKPAARPAEKRKPSAARAAETSRPAGASVNGRWRVSQTCNHGKFEIELQIKQTSETEFSGTSRGLTTGAVSQIVGGRIDGNSVTFSRRATGLSDHWTAQIIAPGRFRGTSSGPAWRCTYTAVRQ
jgi:hypothetical protein